jgi:MraZ protein
LFGTRSVVRGFETHSMLFTGHAEVTIDAKQRLAIPAKFRQMWAEERDGKAWFLVPWTGNVLRLYTEARFTKLAEDQEQSLTPDSDQAELEATLFGLAERVEPDSTGRIVIPRNVAELTGLSSEVVVVGAKNRLEIRDRASWNAALKDRFAQMPALVEKIEAKKRAGN